MLPSHPNPAALEREWRIMGNRLSKIYTRTGDDGSTGLGDGARVAKESLRVEAYGSVDETNSAVGVVLAVPTLSQAVRRCLTEVQHDLFDLGGELCIPGHRMVTAAYVDRLETELDGVQRAVAAAQGLHFTGGRSGGGRLPHGARRLPPRRAPLLVSRARRGNRSGRAQILEPPLGSPVRHRARAGAR